VNAAEHPLGVPQRGGKKLICVVMISRPRAGSRAGGRHFALLPSGDQNSTGPICPQYKPSWDQAEAMIAEDSSDSG
jgi:hypothetical protein